MERIWITVSVFNFLDLIFGLDEGSNSHQALLRAKTAKGGTFRVTIEVKDPTLRSLLQLDDDQEMHLDCQVTQSQDPKSFKKVYILSQIDVTETVVAQKKLEKANQKLEQMAVKQMDLIECLQWVTEVGRTAGTQARAAQLIDSIKRQLTGDSDDAFGDDAISIFSSTPDCTSNLLGEGAFGRVFKSKWRDLPVAVKIMKLPAELKAKDRRQTLALTELAISSILLHPNIIKTHSYSIRPVRETEQVSLAKTDNSDVSLSFYLSQAPLSFEVQIIMEYCDLGNLRGAFGPLKSAQPLNYRAVLDIALDVAKGMQHLHSGNVIHTDLKAPNILLQSSSDVAKGFVAKIADFGLSLSKDDALASHVHGFRHGTKSHMAPEILSGNGSHSNASDVYSFSILMFEIYRGIDAFSDMFHLNFDEMVILNNHRPSFPPGTPRGYEDLAAACWSHDPKSRPSFDAIVSALTSLREDEGGETSPLDFSSSLIIVHPAVDNSEPAPVTRVAQRPQSGQPIQAQPKRELTTNDKAFWEAVFNY